MQNKLVQSGEEEEQEYPTQVRRNSSKANGLPINFAFLIFSKIISTLAFSSLIAFLMVSGGFKV